MSHLDVAQILHPDPPAPAGGVVIGRSRAGRELVGYRFGRGALRVSLIAGCHADEPVGPAMLDRLASWLATRGEGDPLLETASFWIVPHANPDGESCNIAWAGTQAATSDPGGYDLRSHLRHVVRELPGDDVEFGFPREAGDVEARPENRAIAAFLAEGAPFSLHASFHGMTWAAGPWFLMEAGWAERTMTMRERLRRQVAAMGYIVHDVDRGGEKGFSRIDEGFTTRPDSKAMIAHFRALGEETTASLFRPSSMEHVRALGGDPLTLVSEMPLFLLPRACFQGEGIVRPAATLELRRLVDDAVAFHESVARHGVRPMPILDQMRLQLAFLEEGMEAAGQARSVRSSKHPAR